MRSLRLSKKLFAALAALRRSRWRSEARIVGAIGIFLPEVWGNGFEGTNRILRGNPTLLVLGSLLVGKLVATSATIGSGGVGGVFTPSLLVGAALGGVIATLTHVAVPGLDASVGGYALLGMGGLLAGVTRAPLLAVLMIFELTQNTAVILPMMVVSVLAVALGAGVREGLDLHPEPALGRDRVGEDSGGDDARRPSRSRTSCARTSSSSRARRRWPRSSAAFLTRGASISTSATTEGRLLGAVDLHDIKESFPESELSELVIAEDLVTEIPFVTPEEALTSVNEKLWFRDLGQLPVVDSPETGASSASSRGATCSERSTGGPAAQPPAHARADGRGAGEIDYFELPEKHRMIEVDVPGLDEGRTIAEAASDAQWRLRPGRQENHPPGSRTPFRARPRRPFRRGDVLIVLGTDEAIESLRDASPLPLLAGS